MPVALALLLLGCASAHESGAAAIKADEGSYTGDGDCAFTRVAQGACCPMLCTPRAVTKKRAAELEANLPICTGGKPESCPKPVCRDRGTSTAPVCEAGRCVARTVTLRAD